MAALAEITDFSVGRDAANTSLRDATAHCEALERGDILLLRAATLPDAGWQTLRQIPAQAVRDKNIAYNPSTGRIRGFARGFQSEPVRIELRAYSGYITRLCEVLLSPYAKHWRVDLTSFRPLEEKNRNLSARQRNDRLHVDSFPSRPTNGDRILRCFTNIHPSRPRVWLTAEPLNRFPGEMLQEAGLGQIAARAAKASGARRAARRFISWIRTAALPRPPYDRFMLQLHNYMKSNPAYYEHVRASRHEFPAGSTWLVFTDAVPHAVLEGQFALEQTFIIRRTALVQPEDAPVAFLERRAGNRLTL
jgi:3-deoxy-D-manno-oct-2-ulosonic acid (Kdo) hydroxylase